jgi:hypothetical protein
MGRLSGGAAMQRVANVVAAAAAEVFKKFLREEMLIG